MCDLSECGDCVSTKTIPPLSTGHTGYDYSRYMNSNNTKLPHLSTPTIIPIPSPAKRATFPLRSSSSNNLSFPTLET